MRKTLKYLLLAILLMLMGQSMLVAQPCLPDGIVINSQSQIDSFPINHPWCTMVLGGVNIYGDDITNLSGLSALVSISGTLSLGNNDSLINFEGLENLSYIGGNLAINFHDNLESLFGFVSLDSIGGTLVIFGNNITNLSGLENLKSVGEYLIIDDNYNLQTLTGIDNIEAESIIRLKITFNPQLSICNVQSICDHLANPNESPVIYANATGCNNVAEVEEACTVYITEQRSEPLISTYPNPFTTSTTIKYELTEPSHVQLTIYNAIGEAIHVAVDGLMLQGKHNFTWSAEGLPEGLYYAVMRSEEGVSVVKILKQ